MSTRRYRIECARSSLDNAIKALHGAEQYLSDAQLPEVVVGISKIISAVNNRNKELGNMLIDYAKVKP